MKEVIERLRGRLTSVSQKERASKQEAYLRGLFVFLGVTNPQVQSILKEERRTWTFSYDELLAIGSLCYEQPEREFHYIANYLWRSTVKQIQLQDITLIKERIIKHSWWDTIDVIAPHILGDYFRKYPLQKQKVFQEWSGIENIWLHRSLILSQLTYKSEMDEAFLEKCIIKFTPSNEFFIQKSVGWILREYAKTNEEYVLNFVKVHFERLSSLSKKEALKHIKK